MSLSDTALLGVQLEDGPVKTGPAFAKVVSIADPDHITSGNPALADDAAPSYVSGEVIVKFKDEAEPSSVLRKAGIETASAERIHSIGPVVARFRKSCKLAGTYSFMGKNYEAAEDIPEEGLFKEAYTEMPETERALYRSYRITIPKDAFQG